MKKSQNQLVLDHLINHGYITEVIARSYGVRRLASRIHDLKTTGNVIIDREMKQDDAGVPYAYYSLSQFERDFERSLRERGTAWNGSLSQAARAAA